MATSVIRNLINSQINKRLFKIKQDLRTQGMKQVQKVKEKMPGKEEIKSKFISDSCSLKAQDKMTKMYEKQIRALDNLKRIPEKGLQRLQSIERKLKKIRDKIIPKIEKILKFLKEKVTPILLIVVIVCEVALAASAGLFSNGKVIDFLSEKKKIILGKIKEYSKLALAIIQALPPILKIIEKLFNIMGKAIDALRKLIAMLQKLKDFVIFLYRNYIQKCNVANQTPVSNDGSVNADLLDEQIQKLIDKAALGTLTSIDTTDIKDKMTILYNDLLEDLKEQGKTRIIERLIRTEDDIKTSYKVVTVPIP